MAITAAGVGSGLDINGIVTQLMALERIPVNKLEANNREYEAQLSAYGQVRSALSSFETAMEGLGSLDKFKVYSASSTDEDILTASTTSAAANGTYNLEVTRLAQNHKMASGESSNTDEFRGNLTITIGTDSLTINIPNNDRKTLEEIRDLINQDANNPGVTASIINVDAEAGTQRLVFTADEKGYEQRLQTSGNLVNRLDLSTINQVPDTGGGGDTYVTLGENELDQLDAAFTVDSFEIISASNQVSNVIDGITFNLKDLGAATLTIDRDEESIKESVQSFVDAYNDLFSTLDTVSKNELNGDSTIRSIQSAIRSVYYSAPTGLTGTFQALVNVGLDSDARTGTLSLDTSTLEEALATDFQSVAELFAHDNQGFAFRLAELADTLISNNNIVDTREEGLRGRIDDVENQLLSWEYRLELKEASLRAEFARLDSLIGSLQSTSSFLASQLGQV